MCRLNIVMVCGIALLVAAGGPASRAVRAVDGDEGTQPSIERVQIRPVENQPEQTLEGAVIVEALDGGLLLELADQRLAIVDPATIIVRQKVDRPEAAETPRELGRRILAELPAGFDQFGTKHYVICFDTSRAYAQWCGSLFERLHDAFSNFWRQAGLELHAPERPLVVVIFSDRQRYEAFAARDLGAAADRVVGYYNLLSNRVTTFDLTGSDTLARRPARSARSAVRPGGRHCH